jgi:hypothetical protein
MQGIGVTRFGIKDTSVQGFGGVQSAGLMMAKRLGEPI